MATLIDNFDSYSTGDLNGQGSWSGDAAWDVVTTQFQSSPNSAGCSATGANVSKSFTSTPSGNQVFYIRASALNVGATNHMVRFNEGGTFRFGVFMNEGGGSPGDINLVGIAETVIDTWVVNTWYKVEVQWQTSDNTVRARVNDGTWTSFVDAESAFSAIDGVTLRNADTTGSSFFVDSFSDPNSGGVVRRVNHNLLMMGAG